MTATLDALLNPRSIVFVGASADPKRIGGIPLHSTVSSGFGGTLYAINPKYDAIAGVPCFVSIDALPEAPDLAVLSLAAGAVLPTLEACAARGIPAAVVFASGFAETGAPEDIALQEALVAFVKRSGMAIAGPNSLGIVNLAKGICASFTSGFNEGAPDADLAIISQSGVMAGAVHRNGRAVGLSTRYLISTGNEACLGVPDYLESLIDDPDLRTTACYVEALRDGGRFLDIARRYREQGKLLTVLKVGRSARGAEAAMSHTAALAGNDTVYRTAFASAGVAMADDLLHLVDMAYLHRFGRVPKGRGAGIITVSGAAGVALADGFEDVGIAVPDLSADTEAKLADLVHASGRIHNPVDITANAINDASALTETIRTVAADPSVDIVVVCAVGSFLLKTIDVIGEAAKGMTKPIVLIDTHAMGMRDRVEATGIPYFDDMTRMVRALGTYAAWATTPVASGETAELPAVSARANAIIAEARAAGHRSLTEAAGKALLAEFGVPVVADRILTTRDAAVAAANAIGGTLVLKLVSPDVPHKTEVGGVKLNIAGGEAAGDAFDAILASAAQLKPDARIEGVSVQPQVTPVAELLVGCTRDPVFGWTVTIGFGGIWTELLADVVHRLAPVSVADAEAALRQLRAFKLLDGYRGTARGDIAAVAQAISALSNAVLALDDAVDEVEINPLIARPDGEGAIAADALVVLKP